MRVVLAFGLVLLVAIALFPPHRVVYATSLDDAFGNPAEQATVYAPIGGGPALGHHSELYIAGLRDVRGPGTVAASDIDTGRLLSHIAVLVGLFGVAALLAYRRPTA